MNNMPTYLIRAVKKLGYGFAAAGSGAAAVAILSDRDEWGGNLWGFAIALVLLCVCFVSFSALLRLRTPALFFSLEAKTERLHQRLRGRPR